MIILEHFYVLLYLTLGNFFFFFFNPRENFLVKTRKAEVYFIYFSPQSLSSSKSVLLVRSSYFGEGNGTPLQYSCLENPMDGGAWWPAVHGVARSRTGLSDFTFTFHLHTLEKEMALQYSCLENPRDGGAWWAAVYGVTQSRSRLK